MDTILKVKDEKDLENFLYEESINELIHLASKGVTWAKRKVVAELGTDEMDYTPADEGMHWSDLATNQ